MTVYIILYPSIFKLPSSNAVSELREVSDIQITSIYEKKCRLLEGKLY